MLTANDPLTPRWEECLSIVLVFFLLSISFLTAKLIHKVKLLHFIPESGITMFYGLMFGLILWLIGGSKAEQWLRFDTRIFDFILLPAIIFEGGYSLKKKGLFNNLATVLMYSVIGTVISTVFIGYMLYVFARYAHVNSVDTSSPVEALAFGAIISAIDPVATIVLLSDAFQIKEKSDVPLIYNLIFGESVINDAISIVLFRIMVRYINEPFNAMSIVRVGYTFAYVSVGSVAIGLTVGFLIALFFKYVSLKSNTTVEVIVLTMMAMSSYFFAEAATLSGILALFICGIVCGRFAWYNLSEYSRLTTPQTFKVFSTAAESYVFLYLGISAFAFPNRSDWKFGFIGIAVLLCLIGRFLNVIPLSLIANIWRKRRITWREMLFTWFSGLRGAIAFVLALHCIDYGTPNAVAIVTTTLFIVLLSVWVCGALSLPLLHTLRLTHDMGGETLSLNPEMPSAILAINKLITDISIGNSLPANMQETETATEIVQNQSFIQRFDRNFLRPLFRKRKDQTSHHLRDLLLSGNIPHSMKIQELQPGEFEELYERLKPKEAKTGLGDINVQEIVKPTQSAVVNSPDAEFTEVDLGPVEPKNTSSISASS